MLRETSTAEAPWTIVEGTDERYRNLTVGKVLLDAMQRANAPRRQRRVHDRARARTARRRRSTTCVLIRSLDLSQKLARKDYERAAREVAGAGSPRSRRPSAFATHSLVLAFEGADAAGKGGAIRRVTGALDARQYVDVPIAAPTDEEKPLSVPVALLAPRAGDAAASRSSTARWYGRVLVERVEGFCTRIRLAARLRRDQRVRGAADGERRGRLQVLAADQQGRAVPPLQGAREDAVQALQDHAGRLAQPRASGTLYEQAVGDMVDRTSTEIAPWTLVEAEDKYFARIKVLKTIVKALERALALS